MSVGRRSRIEAQLARLPELSLLIFSVPEQPNDSDPAQYNYCQQYSDEHSFQRPSLWLARETVKKHRDVVDTPSLQAQHTQCLVIRSSGARPDERSQRPAGP